MESPAMTSASSHRLRSAVSACAHPTHSYLSSSYLGSNIQCESHDSGGCFKKFNNPGKNGGGSSLLDKLNIAKKSSGEYSTLCRKHRLGGKSCSSHCCSSRNHHQHRQKNNSANGRDVERATGTAVLNIFPNQFVIGNDFLSKLKLNGNIIDSKRLESYLGKGEERDVEVEKCEKVKTGTKGQGKSKLNRSKKNGGCGSVIRDGSDNILNRLDSCIKGKNNNNSNKDIDLRLNGKDDSINKESIGSDECSQCGAVHSDEVIRSEEHDISKWQPGHVVNRRTAQLLSELQGAWPSRVPSSTLVPSASDKLPINDLRHYPSPSQVSEMLKCVKECPKKLPTNLLAFEDCRVFSDDTIKNGGPSSFPILLDKNVQKCPRKFSRGMNKYEVFLGGSCNPTTWRTEFAIPALENMGISYYNPQQVDEWRPELLEVEYHAKKNATVMFFVIDNQTRGISALIEVAHLAGNQRKLVLVIQSFTQKNQIICDEEISSKEYEDLKTGQEVLQSLVERQGIPVFDDVKEALKGTKRILREGLRVQDLRQPVTPNRENTLNPQEIFETLDSGNLGKICIDDACIALKLLTRKDVTVNDLRTWLSRSGNDLNGTSLNDIKFDFEHFIELVKEFKRQEIGVVLESTSLPRSCGVVRDVYLGGTIENTSWRESIAIPLLNSHKLSFFSPKMSESKKGFTDVEAAAIESSFVLLFVITSTARSIAAMAIAGHYIRSGVNVVLCVQHLPEDATIGEEKLSESAVKDYNRGRMYLIDIAKRSGVPVFDEISGALETVIQKCTNR